MRNDYTQSMVASKVTARNLNNELIEINKRIRFYSNMGQRPPQELINLRKKKRAVMTEVQKELTMNNNSLKTHK